MLALLSANFSRDSHQVNGVEHSSTDELYPTVSALTPADVLLSPNESVSQVTAVTSSWIDLCSPDPWIADLSQQILKLEVSYAAFCGVMHVIIPGPRLSNPASSLPQYARAILDTLACGPFINFYLWLPMIEVRHTDNGKIGDLASFADATRDSSESVGAHRMDIFDTWEDWHYIRLFCKYNSRLFIALSVPKLLPPPSIQSRWYSEPVRLLTLDPKSFARNAKGYPALSKPHQALVSRFCRLKVPPWLLLCDTGSLPGTTSAPVNGMINLNSEAFPSLQTTSNPISKDHTQDASTYISYLRFLQGKQAPLTLIERFGAGYQDYLQAPLQPLTINLESITYEVFEKDPIKYEWYEKAVARALHDWIEQGKPASGADGRIVVAVVGAGRGPLVTRALQAADGVEVEIEMWALEKNPNAFVLLQQHNATTWEDRVNLVQSDMRTWLGPTRSTTKIPPTTIRRGEVAADDDAVRASFTGDPALDHDYLLATSTQQPQQHSAHCKIDILISELLGSFGDNELSPECLDGVQHLLNPTHGISIPSSYTAFLTPISAPKLHQDISSQSISNPNAVETPYVVMLNAIDYLSTSEGQDTTSSPSTTAPPHHPRPSVPLIKPAWTFRHPNPALQPSSSPFDPQYQTTIPIPTTFLADANPTPPSPPANNNHNSRHTTLRFPTPNRGPCHGLAGYFETTLYSSHPSPHNHTHPLQSHSTTSTSVPNPSYPTHGLPTPQHQNNHNTVSLSTNPNTMPSYSPGMISWFPIYFPLRQPVWCVDNGELEINMWRRTDGRMVWYEWVVDVYRFDDGGREQNTQMEKCGERKGKAMWKEATGRGKEKEKGNEGDELGGGTRKSERRRKRVRVGVSELHSSVKEGCLM